MSMLTRTGTIVRKQQRRRSSTTSRNSHGSRRESVPTPTPSLGPTPSPTLSYNMEVFGAAPGAPMCPMSGNNNGNRTTTTGSSLLLTTTLPFSSHYPHLGHSHYQPPNNQCTSPCLSTPGFSGGASGSIHSGFRTTSTSKGVTFDFSVVSPAKLTPPPSDKPVYESTVIWAEVEEPDTHYSVAASLCEAGLEARHPCEFIHRGMFILSGSWCVTVFLLVLFALPLVMTTIGVNYLHECPREPKLPIYLVVGGCFGIIKLIFLLWKQIKRHKEEVVDLHDDDDLLTMTRMTNIAVNVFLCVWFVFGHYWLIRIWKPHFKAPLHEPRNWCDETVFHFTFWQLVICHIILGMVGIASLALSCCFVCVKCLIQPELQQNNATTTTSSKR